MEHSEDQLRKDKDNHCVGGSLKAKVQVIGEHRKNIPRRGLYLIKKVVKIHWECM